MLSLILMKSSPYFLFEQDSCRQLGSSPSKHYCRAPYQFSVFLCHQLIVNWKHSTGRLSWHRTVWVDTKQNPFFMYFCHNHNKNATHSKHVCTLCISIGHISLEAWLNSPFCKFDKMTAQRNRNCLFCTCITPIFSCKIITNIWMKHYRTLPHRTFREAD